MKHAVIGTGYWGSNHARVGAELVEEGVIDDLILCDIDEGRVSDLADSYGFEYVTDYTDLNVDTAVVATPSNTHHSVTTALLEAGVDCLVEKPLALSSKEAWDIVDTAEAADATLAVGHIFRYHPALRELKKRIDRGELGRIKYLNTNRHTFRVPRDTTGALYSLAVHDVDIYNLLLDESPNSIYCQLDSHIREGIDETATLVLEYETATGVINESWQIPVFGKRRDLVVVGSEKTAYIDYLEDVELEIYDSKIVKQGKSLQSRNEGSITYEVEGYEPLKMEVESFLKASRDNKDPLASGVVGAEAVELLELAEQSSIKNKVVKID
jgi:predicted dehydrogenase